MENAVQLNTVCQHLKRQKDARYVYPLKKADGLSQLQLFPLN